jgi:dipeptidyl-peptidase-4
MRLGVKGMVALAAVVLAGPPVGAQQISADSVVHMYSIDRLIRGRDLGTHSLGDARWLATGDAYTTVEPAANGGAGEDIVRTDAATGARTVVVTAQQLTPAGRAAPLDVEDYGWSPDGERLLLFTNSKKVWRNNTRGDYWVLDRSTGVLRKLGSATMPPSTLMFAKFSPDGRRVAYVEQGNIYVEPVDGSAPPLQLTADGSTTTINGTSDWVYEEEFGTRDCFRWSPDGTKIAYWQFDITGVRDFLLIDDTDSLYSFVKPVQYPKAGTTNSAVRAGVVSSTGGQTAWLQVPGDSRNNYLPRLEWAANSTELVLQRMNRLQNTNALMLADAATGAVHTVLIDRDSTWVDVVDDLKWLNGGKEFLWVSDRDGWRHVYVVSRDGAHVRLVTSGSYDVISVEAVVEDAGYIYYIASPDNATQRYLYRTRLNGRGRPERLSPAAAPGTHGYELSPDARWALHTYSTFDTPPVTDLVQLPSHAVARTLVRNDSLAMAAAPLLAQPVEFFRVDLGSDISLDGWMLKPPGFDATKKYPVLVFVYGEPAAQTVLDRWGGRQMLWHRWLAAHGYIVISVDNRGTPAPKGSAWRRVVYGSIGVISSFDQAAAIQLLARARSYVDSTRVGVWGWSGGGSNTLNAMFRYPNVYSVGMAVAPVPDQRLYDTIYQERYMGLPDENADGYRRGSPINFAEGLRGKLLIVHGSGDDNVHYQGTERLVNRLVALGKPFDLMVYPNRTHAINEGPGTTVHLYSLLTRYLTTNLPAGGR